MKDLLVEKDQWINVDLGISPTRILAKDYKKLDLKAKSTILFCLSYLVLLNVSGDTMTNKFWDNLGALYQSKSLLNKLFLWHKLYNLRIKDGDSITEHINTSNIMVSQLLFVNINFFDEDKCINLLCPLPNSWDSVVVALGSNMTTLSFNDVVSSLLSEEMRWKNMEGQRTYALFARGFYHERNRSKSSSGRV